MLGLGDRNLKIIRESLGVTVAAREGAIRLSGDPEAVRAAGRVVEQLRVAAGADDALDRQGVLELIMRASGDERSGRGHRSGELDVYVAGQRVKPRTDHQKAYMDAIEAHDLVFAIGPAGTGKTYLAVAAAVHLLKTDQVRKVILVRPAVEAGERLGFLPGDLEAKVNPYLRPLLDALHDMMDFATIRRFMENDLVEVVPLAFMRGRTLNSSVIILDEAQNTTRGQMQMFLTRMGQGSKMIVTGDTTQIDLDDPTQSGLIDAARRLRRIPGVAFATLTEQDIVRHRLVQRIVEAYGAAPTPQLDLSDDADADDPSSRHPETASLG